MLNIDQLSRVIVSPEKPLADVVAALDKGALQVVLVLEEGLLIGLITDGDLRHVLLSGRPLSAFLTRDVMTRDFVFVGDQMSLSKAEALRLMKERSIHHIPVLNASGMLVGLHVIDDLSGPRRRTTPVIIMAGGLGQRLRPMTDETPKPLLLIKGKPMLQTLVERLAGQGFRDLWISVNYKGEMIEEYFGNGRNYDVQIRYLREDEPKGTAGALSLLPSIESSILVMNGDVLTNMDCSRLVDFHAQQGTLATVCIKNHDIQVPFAVARTDEKYILALEEKPVYTYAVNAGVYVLEPVVLEKIPKKGQFDMTDLLDDLLRDGERVCAFPMHESWRDVGTPNSYLAADSEQS